jgi:hypothetical protein
MLDTTTKGAQARLISPVIPFIPSGYCLSWFYNMNGELKSMMLLLYYILILY